MNKWLRIGIALSLILMSTDLSAQEFNLKVDVYIADGETCEFCMVQLIDLDSISLLDFKYTDSLGYAKFSSDIKVDRILVRASQFGYRDSILAVGFDESKITEISFLLHPLSIDLDEVTVLDKIALLKSQVIPPHLT